LNVEVRLFWLGRQFGQYEHVGRCGGFDAAASG